MAMRRPSALTNFMQSGEASKMARKRCSPLAKGAESECRDTVLSPRAHLRGEADTKDLKLRLTRGDVRVRGLRVSSSAVFAGVYGWPMRAVFIFVVILLLIAMAVPATFAVRFWMDGAAVLAQAEQNGALRAPAARGPLTGVERTIAMSEFASTWRTSGTPCRTLAFLWLDVTTDDAPQGVTASQKFATMLLPERRETSIRWQLRRLIVSCQLEQRFDDPQLLRRWLARASFGEGLTGMEAASQVIFGKPSRDLNAEESAKLAVLLRAPSLRTQPERWAERARELRTRIAAPAY